MTLSTTNSFNVPSHLDIALAAWNKLTKAVGICTLAVTNFPKNINCTELMAMEHEGLIKEVGCFKQGTGGVLIYKIMLP